MMKRVGIDPAVIDELESSQRDLLLMHHLLSRLLPEVHAELHAEALKRRGGKDDGQLAETVVDGICLTLMVQYQYAEKNGVERLHLDTLEFNKRFVEVTP